MWLGKECYEMRKSVVQRRLLIKLGCYFSECETNSAKGETHLNIAISETLYSGRIRLLASPKNDKPSSGRITRIEGGGIFYSCILCVRSQSSQAMIRIYIYSKGHGMHEMCNLMLTLCFSAYSRHWTMKLLRRVFWICKSDIVYYIKI